MPRPFRELLTLAGPTIVQMMSYTVMQFIDTLMLSHSGPDSALALTAGASSGMLVFSILSVGIGTLWIVNTLVSQKFGQSNNRACGQFLWQGLWFGLGYYVIVLALLPTSGHVFQLFGHEPGLVALEAQYLRITLAWSLPKLFQTALTQFLLAINRPKSVLAATLCGVSVNAVAAWAMIFGHLGASPMGVRGSAWAQNLGVIVEMSVVALIAAMPSIRRVYYTADWKFRPDLFRTLLTVGLGSGMQFVADIVAWSLFSVWVLAPFGTDAMAANTIVMRYMFVSFMPAVGINIAVTALVGRYIGMGLPDEAARRADLGFTAALFYMIACGLVFFVGRTWLVTRFTLDPRVVQIGSVLFCFAAVYQAFDAMYIVYNGALRGAGDTVVPAVATACLCWTFTVGLGRLLAVRFSHLGPAGPWAAATVYGILMGIFMLRRFRRGGWRSIRL